LDASREIEEEKREHLLAVLELSPQLSGKRVNSDGESAVMCASRWAALPHCSATGTPAGWFTVRKRG
jgi:hypothetical protein